MQTMPLLRAGVLSLALFSASGRASPPSGYTMQNVAFLAGCWEGRLDDGTTIRETYTSLRAGSMLGNSQLTDNDRTQFFEFVRITEVAGRVTYLPYPNGKPAAAFPLVRASTDEAVFENPANDFPQRISYRIDSSRGTVLTARIERLDGSKSESFRMSAVACGVSEPRGLGR